MSRYAPIRSGTPRRHDADAEILQALAKVSADYWEQSLQASRRTDPPLCAPSLATPVAKYFDAAIYAIFWHIVLRLRAHRTGMLARCPCREHAG